MTFFCELEIVEVKVTLSMTIIFVNLGMKEIFGMQFVISHLPFCHTAHFGIDFEYNLIKLLINLLLWQQQ